MSLTRSLVRVGSATPAYKFVSRAFGASATSDADFELAHLRQVAMPGATTVRLAQEHLGHGTSGR
jgi:hypothetical protein